MRKKHTRWTDEEVLVWAQMYLETGDTFDILEAEIGVPHSTLWWNFMHRLPRIAPDVYDKVLSLIDKHKHNKPRRY